MTPQAAQQIITKHMLPNISRSKDNQVMTFGQFIDYNRNIFPEESCTKCGGEASPRPFDKKSKLSISLDYSLKFKKFVFIVCLSRVLPK